MGAPIRAGLRRERRRRLILWFASGGLLMLLLLVGTYHYPVTSNRLPVAGQNLPASSRPAVSSAAELYKGAEIVAQSDVQPQVDDRSVNSTTSRLSATIKSVPALTLSLLDSNISVEQTGQDELAARLDSSVQSDEPAVVAVVTLYPDFLTLDSISVPELNTPDKLPNSVNERKNLALSLTGGTVFTYVDAPGSLTEFTPQAGYFADLRLTKYFQNNLSITGGVAYRQLVYRENLDEERAVRLFRPGTIDTVFVGELTGNETYAFTDTIPGRRETRFQYHNRRNIVTLPLLIGWQTGPENSASDWNLRLRAGLEFTFWEQSSGRTINRNGRIVDLKTQVGQGLQFAGLIEAEVALPVQVAGGQPFIRAALRREFGLLEQANSAAARRLQGGEIGIGWRFMW